MLHIWYGGERRVSPRAPCAPKGGTPEPLLAIRRASGVCDDADGFLKAVRDGGDRVIDPKTIDVQILGRFRAVVTCIVETKGQRYHNLRVFVRDDAGQPHWQLLAWANEEIDRL